MDGRDIAVALAVVAAVLAFIPAALGTSAARADFGFASLGSSFTDSTGEAPASLAAGSHPQRWTTTLAFNTIGPVGEERPDGALRDLTISLPPGMVGTPALLPACSHLGYLEDACPAATRVGTVGLWLGRKPQPIEAPVYLLEPLRGRAAQLGFRAEGVPTTIDLSISPRPPFSLRATVTDVSQVAEIFGLTLTLEGEPGGSPFLTLPRSCRLLETIFTASPWQPPPEAVTAAAGEEQTTAGCGSLAYEPTLAVAPTTSAAASPSGLDLDLDAPDSGIASAGGQAAADTVGATLQLPPGLTLDPPAASGLQSCTPAQLAAELPEPDPETGCPEASEVGTATVATPLFEKPVGGLLYVAEPDRPATARPGAENPSDGLFALYLVLRDAERGVLLSLPIQVDADPATGRLTAGFTQLPELPLSHLSLRFNSGPHAPLSTPPGCAEHAISYSLQPSSGDPPLTGSETFATDSDCGSRFEPSLSAGTVTNSAGSSAPFVLDLRHPATGPNLSSLRLTLPPGLAADFNAASTCPDSAAALAACPTSSRLGYVRIALGAGADPLWVPAGAEPDSDVYLAGPYRDAPYSLLVSVPAAAGPFDLGQVVLRAPVRIDPDTAQASVELGGLPQILKGVPLHYRAIRLVLDRPGLIRNPTSCEPMRIELTATAATGATESAGDRFQAADCAALAFHPRLSLRLSGGIGRNGHPAIEIVLKPRGPEANLERASLALPAGELVDARRIPPQCPRELPAEGCPAISRLGSATLRSPLLPQPLRGPIFLRAPSRRYPTLVAPLDAGQLRVLLHGRIVSAPGGRLRVLFTGLPDIPVSKATFTVDGGRRGIVVNSENLCGRQPRAAALLRAQNGKERRSRPLVRLRGGC